LKAEREPISLTKSGKTQPVAAENPIPAGQVRLLAMLRMDLAAVLRGYFPLDVARQLSTECEQLARNYVEKGQLIRRIALPPVVYIPKPKKRR